MHGDSVTLGNGRGPSPIPTAVKPASSTSPWAAHPARPQIAGCVARLFTCRPSDQGRRVPGKNNYTWFQPEQLGDFDIECTVMCGVNHSYMLSKVHVIPEGTFLLVLRRI